MTKKANNKAEVTFRFMKVPSLDVARTFSNVERNTCYFIFFFLLSNRGKATEVQAINCAKMIKCQSKVKILVVVSRCEWLWVAVGRFEWLWVAVSRCEWF